MEVKCNLCPKKCNVDRSEKRGFCKCPPAALAALAAPHMWEEPVISGEHGSGAVFFSGCTLGCKFCQNYEISAVPAGKEVSDRELADIFFNLEQQGVHNINLVSGTQFVPNIISALNIYRPKIPIVWNSGGYENIDTIDMLSDYVDIWLPDFKYADGEIAKKYSGAADYPEIARKAILRMAQYAPENVISDGIMQKGLIIRHLILPANTRNSIAVLNEIKALFPSALVSLMAQYIPHGQAHLFPEINRKITAREYNKVCDFMLELGLDGFVQERSSASESFIPAF